jgi:protein phosphatase
MRHSQYRLACFGISDPGLQRTNNQDHFMVADLTRRIIGVRENHMSPELCCHEVGSGGTLLAVADGLGGYAGGEIASQIAVEKMVQALFAMVDNHLRLDDQLLSAVEIAHQAVNRQRQHDDRRAHMASTLTAMHISDGKITVVQVGDSRAYLFRAGQLTLLTEDQTFVNMLQKRGMLTEEEAMRHPNRHVILQALGQGDAVSPDIHIFPIEQGDCVLLCTDGLSSYVSHEDIETILASQGGEDIHCRCLIDAANAAGGADNITVLVARLLEGNVDVL